MEVKLKDAMKKIDEIFDMLISGKEREIFIICNDNKMIKMSSIQSTRSKRIGTAKEEMKNFKISQEEFDSLKID